MSEIPFTVHDLLTGLRSGDFTTSEVADFFLDRIERHDKKVGAFLHVAPELCHEQAAEASTLTGDLPGIPVGLKDLLVTSDMPTTCASKLLENYTPPYDAEVVSRLRAANAVFPGKVNMDEFAMGSSNETSAYQPVRNPWNTDYVPGGSSGGSAAAVAAGLVPAALGSDTGGSIRQPASFCGVTGLKPTYGRVSRYGLVAFASSLDQIGPLTRDARDAALIMNIIAGHDHRDSTSSSSETPDFTANLTGDIKGLKIGIPKEYFGEGIEEGVESAVKTALDELKNAGAELVEISLPHTKYAAPVYYIVAPSEASANLARFDGVRYGNRVEAPTLAPMYQATRGAGFGPEVKRRIMLGTYALSSGYYDAYYLKALKVRTLIQRDFIEAFKLVDVIATPTSPSVAFRFGAKTDDPIQMYLSDIYTISANLAGIPGISVPCGFAADPTAEKDTSLPVGLQLLGKAFDETTILKAADAYQQRTDWHKRMPKEFAS